MTAQPNAVDPPTLFVKPKMIALRKLRTRPIGLQLGPRSATLVQLTERDGGLAVDMVAQGALPPVAADAPDFQEQERERALALRKLVEDHQFQGRRVVTCLDSQDLFVQNVRLPPLPPEEIDVVLRNEADERLPYPAGQAEIRHLVAGQVRQDGHVRQEVILLASPCNALDRHIRMLEEARLIPVAIDVEACAVVRALRGDTQQRCAYLTLSDAGTNIVFAEGNQILFLKNVSSGGQKLDEAVASHLDLSIDEAARIRATVTAAQELDTEDEIHRSVIDAIRSPLESIVTEIELCLRYHKVTFRGKLMERIILTGSEASGWLAEYIGERLGTPCELGDPFDQLAASPAMPSRLEQPWRWTAAVGLSMKGRTVA